MSKLLTKGKNRDVSLIKLGLQAAILGEDLLKKAAEDWKKGTWVTKK